MDSLGAPNLEFGCPNCSKPILIRWEVDKTSEKIIESHFEAACPHCGWKGTLFARDGRPLRDLADGTPSDRVKANAKKSRKRLQYEAQLARKWMLRHQP